MKNRKYISKEAVVLIIATILVLTSISIVPTTIALPPPHDLELSEILSPPTSGTLQIYSVKVKVKNNGTNPEVTDVQVDIIETSTGAGVYADLVEDVNVPYPGEVEVRFLDWTPPSLGEYKICAYTLLADDDPTNNKLCQIVTIGLCDIEIDRVWGGVLSSPPTLRKVKATIKNNGVTTDVDWDFSFTGSFASANNNGNIPGLDSTPQTVSSKKLPFGLSLFSETVTVTATAFCGDQDAVTKHILVIGFLWLVV